MTGKLNIIVLGLTPIEKWRAARNLEGSDFVSEQWFILTAFIVLIILAAGLLLLSHIYNNKKNSKPVMDKFLLLSDKRGLSRREREILLDIATKTKLKRKESIFTMVTAFNRGAAELVKETNELFGAETGKILTSELSILREKLGFRKIEPELNKPGEKPDKITTRQILPGKKLHITRRTTDLTSIESTVVDNNDIDFTVELSTSLESSPGEQWTVRYYFGAAVWEFETSAVNCHGNILVFNHSDNVRFINRRRFLRVPVNKPTYIAQFPFGKTLEQNNHNNPDKTLQPDENTNKTNDSWGPPEFVRASITELGGPGLRIEAPLEVNVGDRILVVLMLNEEENSSSKSKKTRIVEDIGQVRHTKVIDGGFSIAVELTGLNESNIGEMVRATNEVSIKTRGKKRKVTDSMRA